jgi:hypothetical protein
MFRPAAQAKARVMVHVKARTRDIGKRWVIGAFMAVHPGSRAWGLEVFDRKALNG